MADRIHYNGQDKWKQKATELLNQGGGGGGGNVDDVYVNGVSVVDENKVAQIDLSDYATQSYVTNALDDYTTTIVLQSNYYNKTEVNSRLADKADASSVYTKSETYSDDEVDALLSDKADTADLATVATSGSYNDLNDKPSIPTVNDGTLTLKNGDQTKGTFGANQSTAANVVILPFDIVGNTTIGFTPVYPS